MPIPNKPILEGEQTPEDTLEMINTLSPYLHTPQWIHTLKVNTLYSK